MFSVTRRAAYLSLQQEKKKTEVALTVGVHHEAQLKPAPRRSRVCVEILLLGMIINTIKVTGQLSVQVC